MGKNCTVLDSPEIVAVKLDNYLKRHGEIEGKIKKDKKRKYFTTDDVRRFENLGQKFLGESIQGVKKIELK